MTVADRVRSWLSHLDLKSYGSLLMFVTMIVAVTVFGVIPRNSLLFVNAFLSGSMLTMCFGIIVWGADKVRAGYLAAACLVAGGLVCSIPALFFEHAAVDWGSSVSRLGFVVLLAQVVVDLIHKFKEESRA